MIEALTGWIRWKARDRLSLHDRAADQLCHDAIAAIDLADGPGVRSFPVRNPDTQTMMVAHLIPIRLSARDIFVRCAAVLVLTPVTLPHAPPVELVQSLFDLTPAEARVARGLASGKTVDDIALGRQYFSEYDPHAHPRRAGENRQRAADRRRCPSCGDFVHAADRPRLTGQSSQNSENIMRLINFDEAQAAMPPTLSGAGNHRSRKAATCLREAAASPRSK